MSLPTVIPLILQTFKFFKLPNLERTDATFAMFARLDLTAKFEVKTNDTLK